MDQPVYAGGYGIRLVHQNPDEVQQQQQAQAQTNYIMTSHQDNNQILIADESTGQNIPVQHIQNNQYIQQQDGSQYLIQNQSPAPQQVFYTNIPQQTQMKRVVIQAANPPQKVQIIQRQPDQMMQNNPPPLVDQHNQLQYGYHPQQHMDQGQQIIVQHQTPPQMKQTIYQQNQIVQPQQQYIQLQGGNIVQGQQIKYIIRPQMQTQQQMMVHQSPEQQAQVRPFRPRVIQTMRVARPNSPQLQQISFQQQQQQRPRTPVRMTVPRLVRPGTPQTPQQSPQQQQRLLPPGTRMQLANGGQQQFYVIQQNNGEIILAPSPQQTLSSPPQLVRTSQAQIVQQSPQNQQQQQQEQVEEHQAPTTSTIPTKGDGDDLEDSITATAISKSAQQQSNEAFRRLPTAGTPQRNVGVVRPMNVPQRAVTPRSGNAFQIIRQRTPQQRPTMQAGGRTHALGVRERESAKMLVILDNGEQRLITFTLPKETCTVQELLDQVGIEVGADSNIECIENPSSEIDYIVKVGRFASREDTMAMTKAAENHIRQQQQQAQRMVQQRPQQVVAAQEQQEPVKTVQEAAKLPQAKYIEGLLAICNGCGASSVDHAKCERCHRIFTGEVKTHKVPAKGVMSRITIAKASQDRKDQLEQIQKKHQMGNKMVINRRPGSQGSPGMFPGNAGPQVKNRGRSPRAKPVAPEIVTLSSDDEDSSDSKTPSKNGAEKKPTIAVAMKKPFEPTIHDDKPEDDFQRHNVIEFAEGESKLMTSLKCRSIRIGSYKFETSEKVDITNKGIRIVAPSVTNNKDFIVLDIQASEVVKVITHFSKQLQIIFVYTKPSCARYIVEQLSMTLVNEKSPYYAPLSQNETHKKIVMLIDNVTEENKQTIRSIYSTEKIEDITNRDANELLVRSNGIAINAPNAPVNTSAMADTFVNGDYKKLITYPQARGGITITTYDYMCLGSDNYLNDVIIDFYLKYIHHEMISEEQRAKSHVFSQFFYKRLTTMNKEKETTRALNAAQKRHARVSGWTKNVNIFEKDFIVVPINEQSHWFLAIICFPNLTEPRTMDNDQPIKLVPAVKRTQKKTAVQIGSTTITPLTKKDESVEIKDDASERDEAEGDDSEMGSNAESDEEEVVDKGQPVKVPCILIFDSLGGASRARVVATLRDYLACEYRVKYPDQPPRVYNKTSMVGSIVKVPQQLNFTDCGLFLLQYVEHFFKDPIKDYRLPIKSLMHWFPQELVTRKREDISNLIKQLMEKQDVKDVELPKLEFPTQDGKIIEQQGDMLGQNIVDDAFEDEAAGDEDYVPEDEELDKSGPSPQKRVYVSKKRSLDANENGNSESSNATKSKRNKTT